MKNTKKLGIWMDHANGHLIDYTSESKETSTIKSKFTSQVKKEALNIKGEYIMHNKEQQEQSEYYKELGEKILNYDEVVIFGPTDAKSELFNLLRKDHRFEKIKIEIKQTDKLTENQQLAFVKDHFLSH